MSFRSVFKDQIVFLLFRRLKTATQLIYHLGNLKSITFLKFLRWLRLICCVVLLYCFAVSLMQRLIMYHGSNG